MVLLGLSICVVLAGVLACARAWHGPLRHLSEFERKRRVKQGDPAAIREQEYEVYKSEIRTALWLVQIGIVMTIIWTAWGLLDPAVAIVVILTTIWLSGVIAHHLPNVSVIDRLGRYFIAWLLILLSRYSLVRALLRGPRATAYHPTPPASRQEVVAYINHAGSVLSSDEKQLLLAGLEFDATRITDIMVPRQKLVTIQKNEVLGPLTIHELHQADQQWFPVVAKDVIVGMIDLDQLTAVGGDTQTKKAETIMQRELEQVKESADLRTALKLCLTHHQSVVPVVSSSDDIIGLVFLEDIIAVVFGEHVEA